MAAPTANGITGESFEIHEDATTDYRRDLVRTRAEAPGPHDTNMDSDRNGNKPVQEPTRAAGRPLRTGPWGGPLPSSPLPRSPEAEFLDMVLADSEHEYWTKGSPVKRAALGLEADTEVEEEDEEEGGGGEEEDETEEGEDENEEDDCDSSDNEAIDKSVAADMEKLTRDFPSFAEKYRLIKRIGEGTFSTVYKAEDKMYDYYQNDWDMDAEEYKWTPPPIKRHTGRSLRQPRRSRYVAIKKIYVTSSPSRILNELELLHDLRNCPSVCPLITAFRQADQVVAILPYFRHGDFRAYFREMTIPDIQIYLRSLFVALKSTHKHKILHRDIKPTNFLYDPSTQRGVLVDFGLAEREGSDSKPCLCHESRETRKWRQQNSVWAQQQQATPAQPQAGYPKQDTRPSRRANRAGTRGFRAPEVLFKCTEQTTAIDIWSAGVILLTIMSKRFPFFNSADDVEAMIEIATIHGVKRMRQAGLLHGCVLETNIPTIGQQGFSLEKIILWSTCRGEDKPLTDEERLAVRFLERCLDLDPAKRISAAEALEHEFLALPEEASEDDVMDLLAT